MATVSVAVSKEMLKYKDALEKAGISGDELKSVLTKQFSKQEATELTKTKLDEELLKTEKAKLKLDEEALEVAKESLEVDTEAVSLEKTRLELDKETIKAMRGLGKSMDAAIKGSFGFKTMKERMGDLGTSVKTMGIRDITKKLGFKEGGIVDSFFGRKKAKKEDIKMQIAAGLGKVAGNEGKSQKELEKIAGEHFETKNTEGKKAVKLKAEYDSLKKGGLSDLQIAENKPELIKKMEETKANFDAANVVGLHNDEEDKPGKKTAGAGAGGANLTAGLTAGFDTVDETLEKQIALLEAIRDNTKPEADGKDVNGKDYLKSIEYLQNTEQNTFDTANSLKDHDQYLKSVEENTFDATLSLKKLINFVNPSNLEPVGDSASAQEAVVDQNEMIQKQTELLEAIKENTSKGNTGKSEDKKEDSDTPGMGAAAGKSIGLGFKFAGEGIGAGLKAIGQGLVGLAAGAVAIPILLALSVAIVAIGAAIKMAAPVLIELVDIIGDVFMKALEMIPATLESIGSVIESIGGVIVDVITAISDSITDVMKTMTDSMKTLAGLNPLQLAAVGAAMIPVAAGIAAVGLSAGIVGASDSAMKGLEKVSQFFGAKKEPRSADLVTAKSEENASSKIASVPPSSNVVVSAPTTTVNNNSVQPRRPERSTDRSSNRLLGLTYA